MVRVTGADHPNTRVDRDIVGERIDVGLPSSVALHTQETGCYGSLEMVANRTFVHPNVGGQGAHRRERLAFLAHV
ncbi:hypothetical protein D3C72_1378760 [compost metagenome]